MKERNRLRMSCVPAVGRGDFKKLESEDGAVKIDTIFQNETIWLTQNAMAELFGVNVPAISKHLKNIFEEGELQKKQLFPNWK